MSKTKVLWYLKVMISKFRPVGHLIVIFIRGILPHPRTIWAVLEVSHFWNKCSSTVYTKSALDLVGQCFLKMMLGEHVWMGGQNNFRGGIYHGWCHGHYVTLKFPNLNCDCTGITALNPPAVSWNKPQNMQ